MFISKASITKKRKTLDKNSKKPHQVTHQRRMMNQTIKSIKHLAFRVDLMATTPSKKQNSLKMKKVVVKRIIVNYKLNKSITIEIAYHHLRTQTKKSPSGRLSKTQLVRISLKFAYQFILMSLCRCCKRFQRLWNIKIYWLRPIDQMIPF